MSDPLDYATPQHRARQKGWVWALVAVLIVVAVFLLSGLFWTATTVTPLPPPTTTPMTRIG